MELTRVELSTVVLFFLTIFWRVGKGEVLIDGLPNDRPLVIAHRGSSGMRPEHTIAAYQLAVDQGADVIECDLAVTKDRQLICTHDCWLNATTNVATFPEFQGRVKTYKVDGIERTDYFTVDFTLDELKQLRKKQDRDYRDQSFNGKFQMASFDEYIAVAKSANRTVGIYPETKNPAFFNSILSSNNITMEDILLESLNKFGYSKGTSPCFIQSFSEISLRYMADRTPLPLVYLTEAAMSDKKLADVASFCFGIGPPKGTIVKVDARTNYITGTTNFLASVHAYGLKLHLYTFRNEPQFLAWDYGTDPYREYEKFIELGVDGLFTDFPWSLRNYMETKYSGGAATNRISVIMMMLFALLALLYCFCHES